MVVGDIIRLALLNAGVASIAETIYADDMYLGLSMMSAMLAQWQRRRWLVWELIDLPLVSTGAAVYSIGPAGNFAAPRPDKIESAFIRILSLSTANLPTSPVGLPGGIYWNNGGVVCITAGSALPTSPVGLTNGMFWNNGGVLAIVGVVGPVVAGLPAGGQSVDVPLTVIESREDYNSISLKGLSTFPAAVFYDSAYPMGNVYVWPIPPASLYEIHLTIKTALQTVTNLTDAIAMPPEYADALIYSLAVRMCMAYAMPVKPELTLAMRAALNTLRMANTQVSTLALPSFNGRNSGVAASASLAFQTGGW